MDQPFDDLAPSKKSLRSDPFSILITCTGIILSLALGLFVAGFASTRQVLVVVFGLVAFLLTFSRLNLGVAAMIFILYTQMYIIVGERYGVTDVVQGLIMLLAVAMGTRWIVYTDEIPQNWMRPLFLVSFYCIVGLISVMYAQNSSVALPVAVETIKSGIIALIIAIVLKNSGAFRLALWVLLFVGIFLGTLSIIQFVLGTYNNDYGGYAIAAIQNISGQTNDYRLGGPVGDPNFYAQMMLVMVPVALDRLWNEKQLLLRVFALWALSACAFTVLLTYSRGGFVSMVIIVVAMIAILYRNQLRYLLVVAVVALFMVNILPARFTERISTLTELLPNFSSLPSNSITDYSLRGRSSEMIVAMQMFADHPILGVGLGNYPVLYQKYSQRLGLDLRSEARQAHSLYLEVASETGLLGLFSFALLLWSMVRSAWKAKQSLAAKGLTSMSNLVAAYTFGFLGYLLAAMFIHSAYPRNFWVLAGIMLAIPRVAEVEIESLEARARKTLQDWRNALLPGHS